MTVRPEADGFTVEYMSTHTNHSLSLSECWFPPFQNDIRSAIASKVSQGVTVKRRDRGEDKGCVHNGLITSHKITCMQFM